MDTNEPGDDGDDVSDNLIFVNLLRDCARILFVKDHTPMALAKKKMALEALTAAYNLKTQQQLSCKQIDRKFNNMKAIVKKKSQDRIRKKNGRGGLKRWEKRFAEMWKTVTAHISCKDIELKLPAVCKEEDNSLLPPAPIEDFLITTTHHSDVTDIPELAGPEESDAEFEHIKTEDLQRMVFIAQIKAARAQERAANAQEELTMRRLINS